ncbi:hypothetical protein N7524_011267 [Penicillium chrysogenum]|nr:hypothetical protein N7524_011267 [Penicillium chrysogenum]
MPGTMLGWLAMQSCASESPGQPSHRGVVCASVSRLPEMAISLSEYTISSAIHKIDFVACW